MRIDVEKLTEAAEELIGNIHNGYSEVGMTIGRVGGVWFRLVALDQEEAEIVGACAVYPKHDCILSE